MTRPLSLAEALSHPSVERVVALMRATDERGRVLAHEAVARCLAEYDPAQSAPLRSGHRSGVVLAFPTSPPDSP